jgi:hypothetical protein
MPSYLKLLIKSRYLKYLGCAIPLLEKRYFAERRNIHEKEI